jgi:hypothetical protein
MTHPISPRPLRLLSAHAIRSRWWRWTRRHTHVELTWGDDQPRVSLTVTVAEVLDLDAVRRAWIRRWGLCPTLDCDRHHDPQQQVQAWLSMVRTALRVEGQR